MRRKIIAIVTIVLSVATILAILSASIYVFFGVIALIITETALFVAQKQLKKENCFLKESLRFTTWSVMWFMLGSVGTIVSLINQRFGGAELSSNTAGIIFLAPIGMAVCWIVAKILYVGIVRYEDKILREP